MGYYLKLVVGLALFLAGFAAFEVGLVRLLELPVSSCASGNTPYAIASPCPKGTGTDVVLLMGGIFGGLIGAGIYAARGERPGGQLFEPPLDLGFGSVAWAMLFAGTGLVCIYLRFLSGKHLSAGADLATIILAVVFIPMGIAPLIFSITSARDDRKTAERIARNPNLAGRAGSTAPTRAIWSRTPSFGGSSSTASSGGGDAIAKLERLSKLRESGALTQSEFEREKAKLLSEK